MEKKKDSDLELLQYVLAVNEIKHAIIKSRYRTLSARFEDTKRQALIAQSDKTIQQTVSAKSKDAIQQILPAILSWSHYERLMRIKDKIIRDWYMKEAAEQMWNFRTLNRDINCKRLTKI